jgi:23S rRNA pseudouridine2605 synthase
VGRLDYNSEGLLILTNDGELAARIAHPRHGIVREYLVKIRGDLSRQEQGKLVAGADIDGTHVQPLRAKRDSKGRGGTTTWWRIEVSEGRTHEVRELFFRAGHLVQRLRRTAIGPLRDNTLKPGEFRTLSEKEVKSLRRVTSKAGKPRSQRSRPAATRPRRAGGRSSPARTKKNR